MYMSRPIPTISIKHQDHNSQFLSTNAQRLLETTRLRQSIDVSDVSLNSSCQ